MKKIILLLAFAASILSAKVLMPECEAYKKHFGAFYSFLEKTQKGLKFQMMI